MKIGLWYNISDKINGCQKVCLNLKKGLELLGHEVLHCRPGDKNGCLQGIQDLFKLKLPQDILVGPEIVVLVREHPELFEHYKRWTQPAQWVIDYMRPSCPDIDFKVWPVGIDTDRFNDYGRSEMKDVDCFIYYKNVTKQTPPEKFEAVKRYLDNKNIKYYVLEYGKYNEEMKTLVSKKCRFCIYLAGTESQGLAIMEIMSMGCPVYVIDQTLFEYQGFQFEGASSAPYFDDHCGIKAKTIDCLPEFIDNLEKYNPRKYILENHTLIKGAEKYLSCFN